MQHRLLFAQTWEAVRALEEGVLEDIREGDVGAILGWGFAPWSGGPFSWLDIIGSPYAAERCDQLTAQYGERFTTPALLREMANKTQSFYGRFGPQASKAAQTNRQTNNKAGAVRPPAFRVLRSSASRAVQKSDRSGTRRLWTAQS